MELNGHNEIIIADTTLIASLTLLVFSLSLAKMLSTQEKKEHSEVSDGVYSETCVVRILKIHEKQSVGRHSQKQ